MEQEAFCDCWLWGNGDGKLVLGNATNIGNSAFYNCAGLESIETGSSLRTLGSSAFSGCSGLKTATIDGSGLYLDGTFNGCSNLESVVFGDSVTGMAEGSSYRWWSGAFTSCPKLRKLTFGCGLKTVPTAAFLGLVGLEEVAIPGATVVQMEAFMGCTNLTNVVLSPELTEIGQAAFSNCWNLAKCNDEDKLTLTNVVKVGSSAFAGCTSLREVEFGNAIARLDTMAFRGCTGLRSARIGGAGLYLNTETFSGCTNLESVCFGDGVTGMAAGSSYWEYSSVFRQCPNLRKVECGSGLKTVPTYAFNNLRNLEEVSMPGVSVIQRAAFKGCTNLVRFSLPEDVASVEQEAFCSTHIQRSRNGTANPG